MDNDIQNHLGLQMAKTARRHDVDPIALCCRGCGLTKTAILFHCVNECRPQDHVLSVILMKTETHRAPDQ